MGSDTRYSWSLRKWSPCFSTLLGPKFCLSEKDIKKGLTLQKKRDLMCPSFQRWDQLFGDRMNLNPFGVLESTVASDDETGGGGNWSLFNLSDLKLIEASWFKAYGLHCTTINSDLILLVFYFWAHFHLPIEQPQRPVDVPYPDLDPQESLQWRLRNFSPGILLSQ